ncbi:ABC transporter substrate-binding protein [Lampropedia puyangensis]|uniref:ABC transporter substrate-binding protein n=1 Tax=Lampropedia puyangensis TaxID=1330072 RepID=A0A4S8F8Z5_9BURK|nr:helical backbone metal receptor [Lampropedia puyangensis]THU04058.1 ABC transporter substrate-binding protein [Lampropedia puyangensis]
MSGAVVDQRLKRMLPRLSVLAQGALLFMAWFFPPMVAYTGEIELLDDRSQRIILPLPAKRIVSLLPSVTETICALEACDRLVGVDRYSNWPEAVEHLPKIGGLADANIEAIVALRPDLVVIRARNRAASRLQELGLPVLALDAQSHADVRRHMELVAQALGQTGQGEVLWLQVDARVKALRQQVPFNWRNKRVYLELHSGNAAAGEQSFIGEILTQLGLSNVVQSSLGLYPKVAPEFVVRISPDLLIVADNPLVRAVQQRPGWDHIPAVQKQHVCVLPAETYDILMRAGPRLDLAARRIVQCVQRLK